MNKITTTNTITAVLDSPDELLLSSIIAYEQIGGYFSNEAHITSRISLS